MTTENLNPDKVQMVTRMDSIRKLRDQLNLQPLPQEGGFYCETYRSNQELSADVLAEPYNGSRSLSTAIFYLLSPYTYSALYKLPGDEVYHFYLGDPVELLQLHPDGPSETTVLGQDIFEGMQLQQQVVPGGTFQGARLADGGSLALLGTTMAPGFEFQDFIPGDQDKLAKAYSQHKDMIAELT